MRSAALVLFALVLAACSASSGHIPAPANATPGVSDAEATLLIRLDVGQDFGPADSGIANQHVVDYLSDGTVIRLNSSPNANLPYPVLPGTLERNTLNASGLATLHAFLARDADLLDRPIDVKHPGEVIINTFVVEGPHGSRHTISAPDISSPYFDESWVPDPVTQRLGALAKALSDPAALVGSAGLTSPTWEPYRPAKMAVFVLTLPIRAKFDPTGINPDSTPDLSWPFVGDPGTFGATFTDEPTIGIFSSATSRCAFLPTADVESAIASMTDAGFRRFAAQQIASGSNWESNIWRWGARSETTGVMLLVLGLLPEDSAAACIDALSF